MAGNYFRRGEREIEEVGVSADVIRRRHTNAHTHTRRHTSEGDRPGGCNLSIKS